MSKGATIWFETVWSYGVKLLIIKPFSQWNLNKIEIEICIGIWGHSWCCWKAFGELDEFILHSSQLRCGRYWFFYGFCSWKFKQIAKLRFGRKNQLSPQCVHTWANSTGYTSCHKERVVYVWRHCYTRGFSWGLRIPSGSHLHVGLP
jgi:hypothetical protein